MFSCETGAQQCRLSGQKGVNTIITVQSSASDSKQPSQTPEVLPTPYHQVASAWLETPANNLDFAPPALTNQWAMLAASRDFFGYEGFASPPVFAHELQAQVYLSIDDGPFLKLTDTDITVRHRWMLDRIVRQTEVQGIAFESTMAISAKQPVAMIRLQIRNTTDAPKRVRLMLRIDPDVALTDWIFDPGYEERAPEAVYDPDSRTWVFGSAEGDAWGAMKSEPAPTQVGGFWDDADQAWQEAVRQGQLTGTVASPCRVAGAIYEWVVGPGQAEQLDFVHALSESKNDALRLAHDHLASISDRFHESRQAWQDEWEAAFTPGNPLFSGHMPSLETDDKRLRLMYDMAVATVLYCKRSDRRGMGGRAFVYATGLPSTRFTFRVTSAFLWDIKMIAGMLSMLDPHALRSMMEVWMEAGLHNGYGVDFVTKKPLGFWYAINDHALIHMTWQYLRYTGDFEWLSKRVGDKTVRDHLLASARYWKRIAGDDLLADYGRAENLLECVSTYTHKVASFNAANVWNMRTVADLLEMMGDRDEPAKLRAEADELAKQVLTLYVPGEGFWACKQPDGSLVKVRHVLDFFSVMLNMSDDLSQQQKDEMVAFFKRELQEPGWMHALSPLDPDAVTSSRTDHQDEGAYTTWPAYSVEALVVAGYVQDAFDWIGVGRKGPGIADVAKQGPYGQAYFHGGEGSPMIAGSAAKAPLDVPHIEKPVLVSGGKYAQIVIEVLAGVQPQLGGGVVQAPTADRAPVRFVLHHLPIQGVLYRVEVGGKAGGDLAV